MQDSKKIVQSGKCLGRYFMARKTNDLFTFEGKWEIDWCGTSIYDVVYDRSLVENAIANNMMEQIKRGY